MPVPSTVNDLDPTASNNSPAGSEPIGPDLDAYLRAHAAIIRQVSDAGNVGTQTHAAASKATPADADELPIADSEASFGLKKLTLANLKAALKTFLQAGMSMTGAIAHAGGDTIAIDPAASDNSTKLPSTKWIWNNIEALVTNCIAAVATAAGFAASFNANGYIKLPSWLGGFIFQWGSVVVTTNALVDVTFPISFPTSCYAVIHSNSGKTQNENNGRQDFASTTFRWTNSGFRVIQFNGISAGTGYQVWFAVGK